MKRRAFSLIETVIAIAVIGTLVSTILLGITSALGSMAQSGVRATEARIASNLISEILLNDWNSVGNYDGQTVYFDAEGLEAGSRGSAPEIFAFIGRITISTDDVILPETTTQPYEEREAKGGPDLRIIRVDVVNDSSEGFDFETSRRHRSYATWITRMSLR